MTHEATTDTVDARTLCSAFGRFATGVTVVTTQGTDGQPYGAMVTAFAAVSVDPPLAQITLTRSSRAAKHLDGSSFAINILSAGQLEVARHFAGTPMEAAPDWDLQNGVPVLSGNAATLECRAWNNYDGGDHIIVVGEVRAVASTGAEPLLFLDGGFHRIGDRPDAAGPDAADGRLGEGWFAGASVFQSLGPQSD